jgi:uncharacterized C2H2 Zn-finger protein
MCKPIIKCSRCNETFCTGLDYRFHFDKHLNEWYASKDKQEYIKKTTQWEK